MPSFPCNSGTLEPTLSNKLTVILAAGTFFAKKKKISILNATLKSEVKINVLKHKLNFSKSYILHNDNLKLF